MKKYSKNFIILGFQVMAFPIILYAILVFYFSNLHSMGEIKFLIPKFNFDKFYILLIISLIVFIVIERILFSDAMLMKQIENRLLTNKDKKLEKIKLSVIVEKFILASSISSIYLIIGIVITFQKGSPFYGQSYFITSFFVAVESFFYFRKKMKNDGIFS